MKKASWAVALLLLTAMVMTTLAFNVVTVEASLPLHPNIFIRADGSVDPSSVPIFSADNVTYTFTDNINGSIQIERSNILINGTGHTLDGNNNFYYGIECWNDGVTIANLNIQNFSDFGIEIAGSNQYIYGNNISHVGNNGIYLCRVENSVICGNVISHCGSYGIFIDWCSNDVYHGNVIRNNSIGVQVEGFETDQTVNQTFYHNNFVDNGQHVELQGNLVNISFDNGVEGNYWDNYTGVDLDHNGIGDTPHVLKYGYQDNYPLVNPQPIFVVPEASAVLLLVAMFAAVSAFGLIRKKQLP